MYSGTTLTKLSGRILGAHQRFDRVARAHLRKVIGNQGDFPSSRAILHFEGKNGPDAIKRKSPAQNEPWHYYSPFDNDDAQLIELINEHYRQLVTELKVGNNERISFEAAWLAHAIVDGLTPAHHYPYEETLNEIRGEGIETRTSVKDKLVVTGDTRRQTIKKNWKIWGPRGLFTAHGLFELGIATIIMPLRFGEAVPKASELTEIAEIGVSEWFKRAAREIAVLDMFEAYCKRGWTPKLSRQVRQILGPTIVKAITLSWYLALVDSGRIPAPKAEPR